MNNRLYIDAQAVRARIERLKLDYPELSEDADLLADSLEGQTDLHEVMTEIVKQEREAGAFMDAINAQATALYARRDRYGRRRDALRSLMLSLLESADMRKLELPIATVSVSNGRASAAVTDETALPEQFVKTKRSPDMAAITTALKAGESVPGAALRNGSPHLTIRT